MGARLGGQRDRQSKGDDCVTLLQVQGIQKEYAGRRILSGASLHVGVRERVGLVGENGGGKSTLLGIIAGEEAADAGEVQWIGGEQARRIAYLPQEPDWQLERPLIEQVSGVSAEGLARAGIGKSLWRRPVGQLSGGERTRAAMARVLSQRPASVKWTRA